LFFTFVVFFQFSLNSLSLLSLSLSLSAIFFTSVAVICRSGMTETAGNIIFFYKGLLTCYGIYLAYRVRKVSGNWNESMWKQKI
jgi:hypothetical protein